MRSAWIEPLAWLERVPLRVQPDDPRLMPGDPGRISAYFNQRAPWEGLPPLLLSLACLLMGAALLYGLWLYRHRDRHPLPQMTYHRLARAMGLSLGQRLRLWRVARRRGLASPITLMLCPATFDHHVEAYRRSRASLRWGGGRFDRIRQRLFPGGSNGLLAADRMG